MELCRTIFVMAAIIGAVFGQSTVQQSACIKSHCVGAAQLDIQTNYHRQEKDIRDIALLKNLETIVSDFNALKAKVDVMGANNRPYTTYIRWGRTICPNNATTIYEGITGGSHWEKPGSGADYLCLPLQPQWGNFDDDIGIHAALIYGVEYEVGHKYLDVFNPFHDKNASSDNLLKDREVPCVLCAVPRTTTLMIPARNTCPSGWTEEYHGYLMADHTGGHRTSWICVDEAPEAKPGRTNDNDNQAVLYVVEAHCGSLPCSLYKSGRELTCVVCTM